MMRENIVITEAIHILTNKMTRKRNLIDNYHDDLQNRADVHFEYNLNGYPFILPNNDVIYAAPKENEQETKSDTSINDNHCQEVIVNSEAIKYANQNENNDFTKSPWFIPVIIISVVVAFIAIGLVYKFVKQRSNQKLSWISIDDDDDEDQPTKQQSTPKLVPHLSASRNRKLKEKTLLQIKTARDRLANINLNVNQMTILAYKKRPFYAQIALADGYLNKLDLVQAEAILTKLESEIAKLQQIFL